MIDINLHLNRPSDNTVTAWSMSMFLQLKLSVPTLKRMMTWGRHHPRQKKTTQVRIWRETSRDDGHCIAIAAPFRRAPKATNPRTEWGSQGADVAMRRSTWWCSTVWQAVAVQPKTTPIQFVSPTTLWWSTGHSSLTHMRSLLYTCYRSILLEFRCGHTCSWQPRGTISPKCTLSIWIVYAVTVDITWKCAAFYVAILGGERIHRKIWTVIILRLLWAYLCVFLPQPFLLSVFRNVVITVDAVS